jgi:hypothetical protein
LLIIRWWKRITVGILGRLGGLIPILPLLHIRRGKGIAVGILGRLRGLIPILSLFHIRRGKRIAIGILGGLMRLLSVIDLGLVMGGGVVGGSKCRDCPQQHKSNGSCQQKFSTHAINLFLNLMV